MSILLLLSQSTTVAVEEPDEWVVVPAADRWFVVGVADRWVVVPVPATP